MVVVASRQVPARLVVIRRNKAPFQVVHKHDATICRIDSPPTSFRLFSAQSIAHPTFSLVQKSNFFMDFEHQRDGEAAQKFKRRGEKVMA
jgi:hypothetical protein